MSRKVAVLGVPMDLGQGRRGVDMGPSALRCAAFERAFAEFGVEVNPILDRENRTAAMMVELAASLLGKSIL